MSLVAIASVVGIIALIGVGTAVIIAKFYRKVDQGMALIINKMKAEPDVVFTGGVVYPIVHRAERMEISVKAIEIERRGKEGLICKDNIRADIKVNFFVRVNKTREDVLKVAQMVGCARASDQRTLEDLFVAKFSEGLKTVGKRLNFSDLYTQRDDFKEQIIEVIGKDLNGYVLDDAAIDFLEQTPLDHMDPSNILDADGIRKITELTTAQNVKTNELKQKQRMDIGSQDLQADEAIYRFDQQRAEAEARKSKEIASAQAREGNEAQRIQAMEEKKTALVRQKADEEVFIGEENKLRAVEVAKKAREREVQVEAVRVRKAEDLEEIGREREVEIRRIEKEKEIEVQKKEIAEVIRGRIAVEKTVAEEEERIKDLRAHAGAERAKKVAIIGAEAEAEESLVKEIKAAEAQQEVAKFSAQEKLTLADANLQVSDKQARAKIRMAEGVQAEVAAEGLAAAKVKEADAMAHEKLGLAEARVIRQQMGAKAEGEEQQGLARVKVRDADVAVVEREGLVKAQVTKEQELAEAAGAEQKGMAQVRVEEANAAAVQKMGMAEALAIREKLNAEAAGLANKAEAMKALDGVGKEHEEFRLQLQKQENIALETIKARVDVARATAEIMREAFDQARINIVGGDGAFFDKFIKAVTLGQSIDGFVDASDTARSVLGEAIDGDRSLLQDLKDVLQRPAVSASTIKDLTVAALLGHLASGAQTPEEKGALESLIAKAKELGLDQTKMKG